MDQPIPPTSATHGWRREGFEIALIGAEAMRHKDLLLRAGYRVRGAADGDKAQLVFADDAAVDVIVLDFALEGRPPEAVLLFSRRTSGAALLVALVPGEDAASFRRAFMAGARDVLPTPARSEDLLASVDYLLEPRALLTTIEQLRTQLGGDETMALPPSRPDEKDRAALIALEAQVGELRREIDRLREKHKEEATQLRQQLLEALSERDRAVVARDQAKQKARSFRRDAKEGQGQLRLLERACEELQLKLKDARAERRALEARVVESQRRIAALEEAMHKHVEAAELEVMADSVFSGAFVSVPDSDVDVVEEALAARAEDEERLSALEDALQERDTLGRKVRELEQELARMSVETAVAPAGELDTPSEVEAALVEREADERRLAELDGVLEEKQRLDDEVRRLRAALAEPAADEARSDLAAELKDVKDTLGETRSMLEAVKTDRDGNKRRLKELEREAADAVMRIEELSPLVGEVERLRSELRAERDARKAALVNASQVTSQFSMLDRETATLLEELAAKQRALVLAYARHEVTSAELTSLRGQLSSEARARAELHEQLRQAENDLERLRGTLASLTAERLDARESV